MTLVSFVVRTQEPETIAHLLLSCSSSRIVWTALLQKCQWGNLVLASSEFSIADWWEAARKRVDKALRKSYDSLVVLVAWSIWLEHNAQMFNCQCKQPHQLLVDILAEADRWVQARFRAPAPIAVALGLPVGRTTAAL
ncbi:unnamed protein product [Urochloa humidicola]